LVWRNPVDGQFAHVAVRGLDVSTYGGNRADVAAAVGERFRYSGYTLNAALDPGIHLLAVSSQNQVSQAWVARTSMAYVGPADESAVDHAGRALTMLVKCILNDVRHPSLDDGLRSELRKYLGANATSFPLSVGSLYVVYAVEVHRGA
jgi:hypothetical protein